MAWFGRGPNYERDLPRLADEIQKCRTKVISVVATRRRWCTLFVLATLFLYVLGLCYLLLIVRLRNVLPSQFAFILLTPVVAYFIYRVLSGVFTWRRTGLERRLKGLIERRKTLVDGYKKKTNLDHILKLIEDPTKDPKDVQKGVQSKPGNVPNNNAGNAIVNGNMKGSNASGNAPSNVPVKEGSTANTLAAANAAGKDALSAVANGRAVPAGIIAGTPYFQPTWVDRLMDLVLGENESSPSARYALICPHCHAHNGLAPYGKAADEVSYYCPVCHSFNGKQKDNKDANNDEVENDEVEKDEAEKDEIEKKIENKFEEKVEEDIWEKSEAPKHVKLNESGPHEEHEAPTISESDTNAYTSSSFHKADMKRRG